MEEEAAIQSLVDGICAHQIRYAEAIHGFEDLVQKGSQSPDVYRFLSGLYGHAGEMDKARDFLEQAKKLGPSSQRLKTGCGGCTTPLGHKGKWFNGYCIDC